jgi:hypothetical protein
MVPFSLDQKRFLEALLVRQADGELKKLVPVDYHQEKGKAILT